MFFSLDSGAILADVVIYVADLPSDNVDKILALGDIKGIHPRLQLVSDSIPVITVGLYSWSGLFFVLVYFELILGLPF